jgi:hypothetical protein
MLITRKKRQVINIFYKKKPCKSLHQLDAE